MPARKQKPRKVLPKRRKWEVALRDFWGFRTASVQKAHRQWARVIGERAFEDYLGQAFEIEAEGEASVMLTIFPSRDHRTAFRAIWDAVSEIFEDDQAPAFWLLTQGLADTGDEDDSYGNRTLYRWDALAGKKGKIVELGGPIFEAGTLIQAAKRLGLAGN